MGAVMRLFAKDEMEAATRLVHTVIPSAPQCRRPVLSQAAGAELWVKHENHTPTGAFKMRGGITFIDWLKRVQPTARGICTTTRR